MGVGDEDIGNADGEIGTASDVEHHSQLANPKIGFMSGARSSLDREMAGGNGEEVFVVGGHFTGASGTVLRSTNP